MSQSEFVSISELCPNIHVEASYATVNNFTGEIVPGYKTKKVFVSKVAGYFLVQVQEMAKQQGLSLKVFDGYRPAKAVIFFEEWARREENNHHIKKIYYPKFSRSELFERGYIAKQSSHSRGSAIDLTLVDLKADKDLDMGTIFDYFDEHSWTSSSLISSKQKENRLLLQKMMESHGFKNFEQEWWHYSLENEPYPNQYFDFDIG